MKHLIALIFAVLLCIGPARVIAQESSSQPSRGDDLLLKDFRPQSMLKHIRSTDLQRARFPVIDVHTHFGLRQRSSQQALDEFVDVMDRHRIAVCISLDEKLGASFGDHAKFLWKAYPNRFAVFAQIDWRGEAAVDKPAEWACNQAGFARQVTEQLRQARNRGACGVKIFKQFGLRYKNADGSLIRIDDTRWDPIWQACGQLGLPIIIHTADPAAFFLPIDKRNERYEELSRHPDWSFYGDEFPSRDELLAARNRIIERHPDTTFIGAHVANNPEDLQTVGDWLDQYPNLYVEPASRIAELGRQPYTAREFMLEHQDRILFGTDGPWPELRLTYYWRFFETFDEYFPYSEKQPPPQGLWQIYGIGLPDEVLRKIYFENAIKLIPGLREKYERAIAQQK